MQSKTSTKNSRHISHALFLTVAATLAAALHRHLSNLNHLYTNTAHLLHHNSYAAAAILTLSAAAWSIAAAIRRRKVYLVDFACYKHDPSYLTKRSAVCEKMASVVSAESLAFCSKVMDRSGIGEESFLYGLHDYPEKPWLASAREEAEIVIGGAVDDLLAKTGVDAGEIGVVVVNVSTFNPVPSLSAMIVNRYKLREDVLSYNLGGMGCSAGLIALDLAKRLLQGGAKTYALIMSLECPSSGYYLGEDRSKLLPNCLFRMGGAALLLSNKPSDRRTSKYELTHTLRTHRGADPRAYTCIFQEPDKHAQIGISISKDLMSVAGDALKSNITALGPRVLPISEQLRFLAALVGRKFLKMNMKAYVPDFKAAFEHFCIHAGGKAVLDEVEKRLKLTEEDMEPARMSLYRYGNTSSSSVWYQLAYAEAKGRIRKGDRVWQIGFGSGFKCASGVWRALRTVNPDGEDNPWSDGIDQFPIYK